MKFLNLFERSLDFSENGFFNFALDHHFDKTACFGKFLFLIYELKKPQPIRSPNF